jgi:hypothetical protein
MLKLLELSGIFVFWRILKVNQSVTLLSNEMSLSSSTSDQPQPTPTPAPPTKPVPDGDTGSTRGDGADS